MPKQNKRKKKKRIPPPTRKRVRQLSKAEHAFRFFRATVTAEQMTEAGEDQITDEQQDRLEALHCRVTRLNRVEDPEIIPDLEALVAELPDLSYPRNWLIAALRVSGEHERALSLAEQLLAERPDYFFSRLGVAQILYEMDQHQRAAEVLWANGYTPAKAFPDRESFHESEIFTWLTASAEILMGIGELGAAKHCIQLLKQADPDSASALEMQLQETAIRGLAEEQGIELPDSSD